MHPDDEDARLEALHRLNLLDSAPSESFDRITRMAGRIFNLPIAAVSLTDRDRQWFKSRIGVEHWSIPREKAPCAQVAESAETVLIPDLLADTCYRASHLAGQGVRFYAGASLTTREGYSLGALCVLGTEPRQATAEEMSALSDLAKMVMAQIELQHAFGRLDPLSGLPNRTQFLEDLADLGRDCPRQPRLAVLVDLARHDQLSNGIRVMGADYLDRIVQEAGRAISAAVGRDHTVYHVSTTQFAFLAPADAEENAYLQALGDIRAMFRERSQDGFSLATSIGLAPFIAGETPPAAVLRTAHGAAEDARGTESMIGVFSMVADGVHQRRFRLLSDFSEALRDHSQLALAFQPRIDLATGDCVGAEALLRWRHPELGEVSPAEFVPVIEQTPLAGPLTTWVLGAVLAQLAEWRAAGLFLNLSMNISAANLHDPGFAEQAELAMLRHRVRPEWLEMEVTESAVMEDIARARTQLATLVEAGVKIAIDDFGTGHSSLAYLQKLPTRVLKIDQSFVREMASSERERTLVRSMIALGHGLGYRVVAEGVETAEILGHLADMGCDESQGFFHGRPMAPDRFEQWLHEHRSSTARRQRAA